MQLRNPTEYNVLIGNGELFHRSGRFNGTLDAEIQSFNFIDADAQVGGALIEINNDDRDRRVVTTSGRVGYEIQPDYEAFVKATGNWREYKDSLDDNGINRDSKGYSVVGGLAVDFGGLVFGDFFAGYTEQNYDSGALSDISGVDFGADVTWNVTPLTTIVASASRTIEETTIAGASGFFANQGGLQVSHELLRNVILIGQGGFQRNDYEGISRQDDLWTASGEVRYLVNRHFYLSGAYNFRNRNSDVAGADFTENAGLLRAGVQY